MSPPQANMIDVSNFQGTLDDQFFRDLSLQNITTIAVKAGEWVNGKPWEDPQFANNWALASKYNFNRIAYMYMHAAVDAQSQAQSLANIVHQYGYNDMSDRLMADIEDTNYTTGLVRTVMQALDLAAHQPQGTSILYSYLSFINNQLNGGVGLGVWPLYLADTGITTEPQPPAGWDKISYWQFGQEVIDGKIVDEDVDYTNHGNSNPTEDEEDMLILSVNSGPNAGQWLLHGAKLTSIDNPDTSKALSDSGIKVATVDSGFIDTLK